MLRAQDKTRIRAEEIFRAEVRAGLEPPSTFWGRLNKFLTTPLGTILVSSVIAGGVSWTYNEIKIDMELERRQYQSMLRLDSEISWRVQQFIVAFRTFEKKAGSLENFERPQQIFYLFDDYKDRPTSSLLRQLHDLVNEKESVDIKTAYNTLIFVRYTRLKNEVNADSIGPQCTQRSDEKKKRISTECAQLRAAVPADGETSSSAPNAPYVAESVGHGYLPSGGNRNCLPDGESTADSKGRAGRADQYRSLCDAKIGRAHV